MDLYMMEDQQSGTAPYLVNELFELFNRDSKDYIKLQPLKTW